MIMYIGLDSPSSKCVFPLLSWGFLRLPLRVLCSFLSYVFRQYRVSRSLHMWGHVCPHEGEMLPWKGFSEIENSETWKQGGEMER